MARVYNLAGYVTSKNGDEVAFSLLINNYSGRFTVLLKEIEKMLTALVNEN